MRRAPMGAALARRALALAAALGAAAPAALAPRAAGAQWVTTADQFYMPASHNWVFRRDYPFADRLFNAFDYGHAILYETLWTEPNAPASKLETGEYEFLTRRVLPRPPRVPLEETAIEVHYARLVPEARLMFEWAHLLHRQAYDILADERLSDAAKDREMARLLAYYRSRPELAFSSKPKSMKLMQEQPYSLAFRTRYPKFNGLIWAYHWLQVGLYEPLVTGHTFEERQARATATVARFRQMLERPYESMPYQMPMTAAIAPTFAARYPEVAIIFDNLHSMHDVVSDILANDSVPRGRKRAEILRAARLFRDDTSYVMPVEAWRVMAHHMGVENMGGPAVGFTAALPTPTVTYGAVMTHDDATGEMTGFRSGSATGGAHAGHGMAMPADSARPDSVAGAAHSGGAHADSRHGDSTHGDSTHADSTHADSTHHGTGRETKMPGMSMPGMAPAEGAPAAKPAAPRPRAKTPARKPPAKKKPAAKQPPPDPHAGHHP